MSKLINVVAAIIKKNDYYLIVQRNKDKHLGLKWEFPGGKVNINENFEDALKREIKEELDILISVNQKIAVENYKDKQIDIILHYYLCVQKSGMIKLNEHEDLTWVLKQDFNKYDFAGSDKKIFPLL
tara:strand:+ start:1149 stop:1529 length:381 start_codon:yes stop_codon:yes gene_type:complete